MLNSQYKVMLSNINSEGKWILDFTSSSSLSSHSLIKHAVAKTVVVETIVAVIATITWTHTWTQSKKGKLKPNIQ